MELVMPRQVFHSNGYNLAIAKIENKANMFSDCFISGNQKFKFKT
jgi:hypothetical protein